MIAPLVLFDLDGTLADTAPGLAVAANQQRIKLGQEPLPYEQLRPVASHGARGLLGVALGIQPSDAHYEQHRLSFLDDYARLMYEHSWLFPGVSELLQRIEQAGLPWGIVTNKHRFLAAPLVDHLQLKPAVLVCGDTTPTPKPSPAPLLHACANLAHPPSRSLYIGDDIRDMQAGRAAGMTTIAAAWGYCGDAEPVDQWQAHHIAQDPLDTWRFIATTL